MVQVQQTTLGTRSCSALLTNGNSFVLARVFRAFLSHLQMSYSVERSRLNLFVLPLLIFLLHAFRRSSDVLETCWM